jgi:peptidoglycan hydrolase-like protein with peptidoglycan-binding domain
MAGALLDLQALAGNRAVGSLVTAQRVAARAVDEDRPGLGTRRDETGTTGGGGGGDDAEAEPESETARLAHTAPGARPALRPGDSGPAVELFQEKLNYHLGFLGIPLTSVDGRFGAATSNAYLAFRTAAGLEPPSREVDAAAWTTLDAAPLERRTDATAGPAPEYGRMFEDGLLDITLAVGFDEHGFTPREAAEIVRGLVDVRGWVPDAGRAAALRSAAGRPPTTGPGTWFVREGVGSSAGRPVHGVLRFVMPEASGGGGARTAGAAMEGMEQDDLFIYTGHGRHGTGMDFDRNFRLVVHWDRMPHPARGHHGDEEFPTYEPMFELLGIENVAGGDNADRLEALIRDGVVEVSARNEGNIGINRGFVAGHARTPSGILTEQTLPSLQQPLATGIRERRYRLWFFDGCTSSDYEQGIRLDALDNENLSAEQLDMTTLGTHGAVDRIAEAALTYLDGLLAGEAAGALEHRATEAHRTATPEARFASSGFHD